MKRPQPFLAYEYIAYGEGNGASFSLINGDPDYPDLPRGQYLSDIVNREIATARKIELCQYCKTSLHWQEIRETRFGGDGTDYLLLKWCRNCRFWFLNSHADDEPDLETWIYAHVVADARRFSATLPDACIEEAAIHLRRHPNYLDNISPGRLEKLVADLFRANYVGADVMHVGRPGDRGVDVVFIDTDHETWLVQVKRRSRRRPVEPFATIQALAGTLVLEGKLRGIVVTTAQRFSPPALSAAAQLRRRGITIDLVDRGRLNRMLDPVLPDTPWRAAVEELNPRLWRGVNRRRTRATELNDIPELPNMAGFNPNYFEIR